MKFNKETVLIKSHYFAFFAGMSPILPFLVVLGMHLGVPIALQGFINAMVLLVTVVAKPLLSWLADAFPAIRKTIFMITVFITGLAFGCICFIPQFGGKPHYPVAWMMRKQSNQSWLDDGGGTSVYSNYSRGLWENGYNSSDNLVHLNEIDFDFSIMDISSLKNVTSDTLIIFPHDANESCPLEAASDCTVLKGVSSISSFLQLTLLASSGNYSIYTAANRGSSLPSVGAHSVDYPTLVSVRCGSGLWQEGCEPELWTSGSFWAFIMLLLLGSVSFATANSITDAVAVETVGPNGDYGSQRAWGSLGWGLMGPISGLLVDWWSGPAENKDYTPAFMLVFLFMGLDLIFASRLKVRRVEYREGSVAGHLLPLVRQPRFFLFLMFTALNGAMDGVVLNFIFVLQEDLAAGTPDMRYIKLLQGLTLFVQSSTEVPCMLLCDRLVRRIGAERVTTLVLALHSVRHMCVATVGMYGSVWATVAVEVLNGPCYGFGYAAIVVYAGTLAPPGASTTVQSLVNICYESIGYAVASVVSGMLVARIGSVYLFVVWGAVGTVGCMLHLFYVRCAPPLKVVLDEHPRLQKRSGDSGPGTVEENLCLSADATELPEPCPNEDPRNVERNMAAADATAKTNGVISNGPVKGEECNNKKEMDNGRTLVIVKIMKQEKGNTKHSIRKLKQLNGRLVDNDGADESKEDHKLINNI